MVQVSIIIPVYNVEKYLCRCVESIYSQNKYAFKQFEVILVDDGSTDLSGQLCDELSIKFDNIRVFHKINGGLSDARNYGIKEAKGKYICFMDSDDYLIGDLFYIFQKAYENYSDFDILQFGYEIVYSASNNVNICTDEMESFDNLKAYREYIKGGKIKRAAWNKIYLKELFDDVCFPVGKLAEDYGTTYKVLSKSKLVIVTPYKVYGYFQRDDSIMGLKSLKLIFDEYYLGCLFFEFSNQNYTTLHEQIYTEHANLLLKSYSRIRLHKNYKIDKVRCDVVLNDIKKKLLSYSFKRISFKSKLMLNIFKVSPILSSKIIDCKDKKEW